MNLQFRVKGLALRAGKTMQEEIEKDVDYKKVVVFKRGVNDQPFHLKAGANLFVQVKRFPEAEPVKGLWRPIDELPLLNQEVVAGEDPVIEFPSLW